MLTETISLTTDLEQAYFQYAVETITDRALPRVEDGLKPVQRRILYAMHDMGLRHDRPHKKSVRVVGECFVAGTLITTERGFKPIENVTTGERVRTQQGWQPVTALYEMPERDLLQVTLATGMTNVVTPSQKFKVLTPELEYVWKEARDLTTNDHLVVSCQYPEHATYQVIDGPDGPVVLNESLAYSWGQFLSDGRNQVRVNSRDSYTWAEQLGPLDCKAATEQVPPPILCSPASVAWAFISGLYDGDGRVHSNRNTIQYSSASTSLIYQLMTLLQSLGIMSYLHVTPIKQRQWDEQLIQSNQSLYSLEARSDCPQLFAPNARLAWQAERPARVRRSNGKGSHLVESVCAELSAEHLRLYRSQLTGLGLLPQLRRNGSELADFMEQVIVDRLAFVPVACVAPAPARRTYDLQVDVDHEFVAHGMVVHNCLGKYHPHGDQSVYMSMVRMGQDFSMRHALIDGQGNYGSIDGDSPAAMRYTEARLAEIAGSVLQDIDQDTVDFVDNFDGSLQEPVILPAALPNLLINGATGIAVGMATNIPPHNLGEVCDAVVYVADRWRQRARITVDELMEIIPGPDFPTGGVIYRYRADPSGEGQLDTIRSAYEGGQGRIVTQARVDMEDIGGGKANIVVTELPYAVQKSTVLERIAREVRDGKVSGVTDLRDESDHEGMRAVIEVSRVADAREVLESVLSRSQLRETFGVNALALVSEKVNGETIVRPQRLSLRKMLVYFIEHRLNVIVRRSRYELTKREARLHIVQGLLKALDVIDQVIDTIRRSRTSETAEKNLIKKFKFTSLQAQAILAMQLRRLAALERRKLADEEKELRARIRYLKGLLRSQARRLEVVVEETLAIKEKFATPRKTVILTDEKPGDTIVTEADLSVPDGPQMIVVTTQGVQRADTKRFGYRIKPGATSRAVEAHRVHLRTEPEDTVVLVSDRGRAWWGAVGRLPRAAGFSELGLHKDERVVGVGLLSDTCCLVLGTRQGRVKRVKAEDVRSSAEASWATIVGLAGSKDRVLFAGVGDDEAQVMFWGTSYANRFVAGTLNPQATPVAKGVAGIKVGKGNQLLGGAVIGDPTAKLGAVVVSKNGFVKRVPLEMFSVQGRGGRGVQLLNVTKATGPVVAVAVGPLDGSVDLLAADGKRQRLAQVPLTNRANRGKKLVKLDDVIEAVVL